MGHLPYRDKKDAVDVIIEVPWGACVSNWYFGWGKLACLASKFLFVLVPLSHSYFTIHISNVWLGVSSRIKQAVSEFHFHR